MQKGKPQQKAGKILIAIGFVIFYPTFTLSKTEVDSDAIPWIRIGYFFGIGLMVLGGYLSYRGRQLSSKVEAPDILNDNSPDVLYLRSFKKDASLVGYVGSLAIIPNVALANFYTEEEQLAEVLKPFGDMVAIGQPGESLPTPGAARVYVSNDWQEKVSKYMTDAKLIILRVGDGGAGLIWEIKHALDSSHHEKLLFYVSMKNKSYRKFCKEMKETTEVDFPQIQRVFSPVNGFFRFIKDKEPQYLRMPKPFLRSSGFKGRILLTQFQFALKPVFEDFGINWEKPPISKVALFFSILGGLMILYMLISLFK